MQYIKTTSEGEQHKSKELFLITALISCKCSVLMGIPETDILWMSVLQLPPGGHQVREGCLEASKQREAVC